MTIARAIVAVAVLHVAACRAPASSPWHDDLRALATELPARHANAFAHVAEADWRREIAALDGRLDRLDDAHALVGAARVVAAIGDGHTRMALYDRAGVYPIAFTWFEDGIFVTGADAPWAIGTRLVAIEGHPVADAIAALTPSVPRDNAIGIAAELPTMLRDPALLAGSDLAGTGHVTYQLAAADGATRPLALDAGTRVVRIARPGVLPLHLQGPAANYWNKYVADQRLVYFAYNACAEDPRVGSLAGFIASTLAFIDQHPVDRVVVDLRSNGGGDSRLIEPLIDGLATRTPRVFAIIGMHTFSSGIIAAMELHRRAHATLVGGPTSGNPSGYGEVKTFPLPRSKLVVQYSTKLFANPDFAGDALVPEVEVHVRAADWFAGRDPALDAILAYNR